MKDKKIVLFSDEENFFRSLSDKEAGKIIKILFIFRRLYGDKLFKKAMEESRAFMKEVK